MHLHLRWPEFEPPTRSKLVNGAVGNYLERFILKGTTCLSAQHVYFSESRANVPKDISLLLTPNNLSCRISKVGNVTGTIKWVEVGWFVIQWLWGSVAVWCPFLVFSSEQWDQARTTHTRSPFMWPKNLSANTSGCRKRIKKMTYDNRSVNKSSK